MEADNLKDGLESQPSMRMACRQLAEFGDNFKDCLHKPTFHADGLHGGGAPNVKEWTRAVISGIDGMLEAEKQARLHLHLHRHPPSASHASTHPLTKCAREAGQLHCDLLVRSVSDLRRFPVCRWSAAARLGSEVGAPQCDTAS